MIFELIGLQSNFHFSLEHFSTSILQDLASFLQGRCPDLANLHDKRHLQESCKILQDKRHLQESCKILQDTRRNSTRGITL